MSIAGLDVGTTGSKIVVISEEGNIIANVRQEYQIIKNDKNYMEINPNTVWDAVRNILGKAAARSKNDPIKALSVSAMGDTITPFDKNLCPTYNSILAFDSRSIEETKYLEELLGREWLFNKTGMPLHPMYSASKILWLKNNMPYVFNSTNKYLCYEDFILTKLGGNPYISYSNAARTMLFDIDNYCWSTDIIDACSINEEYLAKPVKTGTIVGELDKNLSSELNLPYNIKLVSGGHDQCCGATGAGIFSQNIALDSTGTLEILLVSFDNLVLNKKMLEADFCIYPHCYQEKYCSFGAILTAGAAFKWFRDQFGYKELLQSRERNIDPYDMITENFGNNPTDIFVIPYLAGSGTPKMNPKAKGAIYGLTLQTSKYDIAQSILEGITFELKRNIDFMESLGLNINNIISIGGASNSDYWLQLKANITGKVISTNLLADVCAIGACIIAGYGIGIYSNLEEGFKLINRPGRKYFPEDKICSLYSNKYNEYLEIIEALEPLDDLS